MPETPRSNDEATTTDTQREAKVRTKIKAAAGDGAVKSLPATAKETEARGNETSRAGHPVEDAATTKCTGTKTADASEGTGTTTVDAPKRGRQAKDGKHGAGKKTADPDPKRKGSTSKRAVAGAGKRKSKKALEDGDKGILHQLQHAPNVTQAAAEPSAPSSAVDAPSGSKAREVPPKKEGNASGSSATPVKVTASKGKKAGGQSVAKQAPKGSQTKLSDHFFQRRSTRISSGKTKACNSVNERMVSELLNGAALDCIESFDAEAKGLGVRTTAMIANNRVVVEYNGKLMNFDDAVVLEEKYQQNPGIGCYMYFFLFKGTKYCIDATYASGVGRLVNHGKKKANLKTRLLDHNGKPRLVLVSTVDIPAGTELLYDYGDRRKSATASNEWLDE